MRREGKALLKGKVQYPIDLHKSLLKGRWLGWVGGGTVGQFWPLSFFETYIKIKSISVGNNGDIVAFRCVFHSL